MTSRSDRVRRVAGVAVAGAAAAATTAALTLPAGAITPPTFLGQFSTLTPIGSTVPANGDLNPYGVAVVDQNAGRLVKGDVLVSNFNNNVNPPGGEQGRGSTIVEINPRTGQQTLFAQISGVRGGVGLTTALAILPGGIVVVGNLPTSDGTSDTAMRGGLLVLNSQGSLLENIVRPDINGPWDMTAISNGTLSVLFVTNVLNGTVAGGGNVVNQGTVDRVVLNRFTPVPQVLGNTIIGSGFAEKTDPNALVIGPTGDALAPDGTLYVADTVNNAIRSIPNALFRLNSAGTGQVVSQGGDLNGPLGMTLAPDGDIVTVNSGDGNAVESTPTGNQVANPTLSPGGAGALFGIALKPGNGGLYFVDDSNNTLNLLH